jgi:hypothetical protein
MAQSVAGVFAAALRKGSSPPITSAQSSWCANARTRPARPPTSRFLHTLAPGWHTYWVNRADVGRPPVIDSTSRRRSKLVTCVSDARQASLPAAREFGYKDAFTLLTSVTVSEDWPVGEPYRVGADRLLVLRGHLHSEGGATDIVIETGTKALRLHSCVHVRPGGWAMPRTTLDAPVTYTRADGTMRAGPAVEVGEGAFSFAERALIDNVAEQTLARQADGTTLTMEGRAGALDGEVRGILRWATKPIGITATVRRIRRKMMMLAVVAATLPAPISNGGGFGAGKWSSGAPLSLSICRLNALCLLGGRSQSEPCVLPRRPHSVFG